MAVVLCKRLILVTFILLCFFSDSARAARSLGVVNKELEKSNKGHNHDQLEDHQQKVLPKQDQEYHPDQMVTESANDLLTMDYTPATKKPPIHN